MKIEAFIRAVLDRLLKKKEIVNCARELYLRRWYLLRTKRVGIFIHQFVRSDEDRALHDHPWSFLVVPIWRGYVEHSERIRDCKTCDGTGIVGIFDASAGCPDCDLGEVREARQTRVYPLLGTRFRGGTYRHRVDLIDGKAAWSLFFRFTENRVWGFWLPDGFKPWNLFWQEKCE